MKWVGFSDQYFELEGRRGTKMQRRGSFLFGLLALVAFGNTAGALPAPSFELVKPAAGYHGVVGEDSLEVDVHPPIRASPDVCDFALLPAGDADDLPFMVRMGDPSTGTARLLASRPLNCEVRRSYHFLISARSCQGLQSANVTVHVKVTDVNEFAPVFSEPSYVVGVDEGRLYQQLITLTAHDDDCSPKYGDICRFELVTQDQPFSIDNKGVVSNTEPLDFERSHNHILSVVAYDCGMKASAPVMLTVKVNRVCHLGWKGIPSEVDYWPGSGRLELFPQATLELCSVPCTVQEVHSRVTLSTEHIGRGCDRDTYSAARQRKICGASTDSVDLLPAPSADHPWTAGLHSDDGAVVLTDSNDVTGDPATGGAGVADQAANEEAVYEFEGDGVVVPRSVISHNFTNTFTISTWMKHAPQNIEDKHQKEHILCVADDHQMNRHHTALFVRNCRLILLLRHEPSDGGALNTFLPAEWRWKLPQVCDDEWHHYSVQARLPEVTLYVDGHSFHPEGNDAPEVLDDWPLHPTKGINTTLSVGACWQGSEKRMRHGLTGSLTGLTVLQGALEPVRVLSCLTRCMEALDTPAMELLQPSMELLTNNEMTQITIEGDNVTNLETLLRKVAYTNSRDLPTPGRRPITIDTNILCTSGGGLRTTPVSAHVVVLPPHQPPIIINGTSNFAQEYQSFRAGLRVFPDVSLHLAQLASQSDGSGAPPAPSAEVSECVVAVYPPLNPDHETLLLPDNLIRDLALSSSVTRQGTTITGPSTVQRYTNVLRQLHYANRKPAYYLNRAFKLTCSQTSGRASSNEYLQTVTVIHPQLNMEHGNPDAGRATLLEDDTMDRYGHQATLADVSSAVDVNTDNISDDSLPLPQDLRMPPEPAREDVPHASHARMAPHHADAGGYSTSDLIPPPAGVAAGAGHAVTIIVVVCVGFLVVLVVLAVVRVRAAHLRRGGAPVPPADPAADAEMAWDDTALNITLNPMEMELSEGGRLHGAAVSAGDEPSDDSSDEGSSNYGDDLDSTDEEEDEVELDDSAPQRKELEWDDSTLKM